MSSSRIDPARRRARAGACLLAAFVAFACARGVAAAQVDPQALNVAARDGGVDVLIVMADQSPPALAPLRGNADYRLRRRALVAGLRSRGERGQGSLRAWFDARAITHRDFWIANTIAARLTAAQIAQLSTRGDIARIDYDVPVPLQLPPPPAPRSADAACSAWGVDKIEAPAVWAEGFTGQGVVIGGEDTGYQWDHPALKAQYRGWNGSSADHAYNWHDAIHDSSGNPCGNDAQQPCDDNGHGTHTAGTFAGGDGAVNPIGIAPGARWVGCRNMDEGVGTPSRYIECMQWMLAPTDLAGANPDPDRAPDIVSNSWSCPRAAPPTGEGCTPADILEEAVANLVAGGIFYVAAAQNTGPSCGTISEPPAIYDEAFVVGATDASDRLASFSSRGPVAGSDTMRPDLSAPGVAIRSSVPGGVYACLQGTSMAAPHASGAAALLMSAFPAMKGDPQAVAALLRTTAVTDGVENTAAITQSCGGTPITQWPNYMVGYGRLDAWNAYHEIVFVDGFDP
jgi:subtilisin family serine protease